MHTPRVAAIAIDAAKWSVVDRLMRGGRLPHLRAVAERCARARLRNVEVYRSELVWVQFLTGKGAADHRWRGQIHFDAATYSAYGRGTLDAAPFYAQGLEVPVVAFDLIHSVIAGGVEGDQVTAWGAHSPQYPHSSRPAGLLAEIDRRFGTNPAFGNDLDIGWYEPALSNPLLCWSSRIRRSAWFIAAGLAPGRCGRHIARRWMPDGPGPRRGWPRNRSVARAPVTPQTRAG